MQVQADNLPGGQMKERIRGYEILIEPTRLYPLPIVPLQHPDLFVLVLKPAARD